MPSLVRFGRIVFELCPKEEAMTTKNFPRSAIRPDDEIFRSNLYGDIGVGVPTSCPKFSPKDLKTTEI